MIYSSTKIFIGIVLVQILHLRDSVFILEHRIANPIYRRVTICIRVREWRAAEMVCDTCGSFLPSPLSLSSYTRLHFLILEVLL